MAITGSMGKVYYSVETPTTVNCTTGAFSAGDGNVCWEDEITRFEVNDSVQTREFGHDKSRGWQDIVSGTRRLGITLNAMYNPTSSMLAAGRVVYLKLYPFGTGGSCNTPLEGYAMVQSVSYTYDQERGDPVSYTMTLSSKLAWSGWTAANWGGFEDQCT